jgi:hypothetical protein
MVTVRKVVGQNGGEVPTWFARIFGRNSFPVQAQAVAVVSNPGNAQPGALNVPVAISDHYDSGSLLRNVIRYGPGNPITIFSAQHPGLTGIAGQWTPLTAVGNNLNNASDIRNILDTRNTVPVNEGQNIHIANGTMTSAYNTMTGNNNNPNPYFIGHEFLIPVVEADNVGGQWVLTTNHLARVVGFVGFHIVSIQGPANFRMTGYFVNGFTAPNTGGSGPNYGAWTPPHLVL